MKYLNALIAREAAREASLAQGAGSSRPTTDITAKSPEGGESEPFVGNVSAPPASLVAESPTIGPEAPPTAEAPVGLSGPVTRWSEDTEERAAIMEFDGGLDRAEAERRASSPSIQNPILAFNQSN